MKIEEYTILNEFHVWVLLLILHNCTKYFGEGKYKNIFNLYELIVNKRV